MIDETIVVNENKKSLSGKNKYNSLPLFPIRKGIILPTKIANIKASRAFSIEAIKQAVKNFDGYIIISEQISDQASVVDSLSQINKTAVLGKVVQASTEKDGTVKALINGLDRKIITTLKPLSEQTSYVTADFEEFKHEEVKNKNEEKALRKSILDMLANLVSLSDKLPADLVRTASGSEKLHVLIDLVATYVTLSSEEKNLFLDEVNLKKRAILVCSWLERESQILQAEINIRRRVESQVGEQQRQYYLNEQIRAIYKEMGREDTLQEAQNYREKGKLLKLSSEAYEKLVAESKKLEQAVSTSPEVPISRNYIEWLLSVPWFKKALDRVSLSGAKKILDASHAGMNKVKDRIIEFLAAKKFAKDKLKRSPIICLIGPPGVGKTSLASSIAESLGRPMVRISLGGLKDEAEIRGHRKTYIGSMPGKIISAMKKAKVTNPVILLDEIDKMASDFRGDPSSALLEVLDPEQNKAFVDHFMEVEYDLSGVTFIATANLYENIPYPLLDRMELINLSGYTEKDKLKISQKFLLPKLLKDHALTSSQVKFSTTIIEKIISSYTREAGVRSLYKVFERLVRKSIQKIISKKVKSVSITEEILEEWLGPEKYRIPDIIKKKSIGVATGLAWTELGGDILEVEVLKIKGKGGLTITGQLGEVMQESAQAALSYIRSNAKMLGLDEDFYSSTDLHIHIPEGATPKDGPSAGITMTTAIISVLSDTEINPFVAMSGEVTLQGRVLPVGGLKEKLLAAIRFGIKKVIIPKENKKDVGEFKAELENKLEIVYVDSLDEVLKHSLKEFPISKKKKKTAASKKKTVAKKKPAASKKKKVK